MLPLYFHVFLFFALFAAPAQETPATARCRTWQECRQLAGEAASRQDFETFHDLAWRAVQLGPKNDPALMYLVARAQSLSGRPNDAIVMLERLVTMGVPVDAATNEDFRRVRALPGWPALQARLAAAGEPAVATPAPAAPKSDVRTAEKPAAPDALPKTAKAAPAPTEGGTNVAPAAPVAAAAPALAPFRFKTPRFTPAGLAYDAVSRRFVVGDRDGRKLAVVDEFSQRVANLAGAQTSGFGDIAALEIDPHEGNLWVVSSEGSRTSLHKLQLISGRLLSAYPVPEHLAPVSLGDVAVAGAGVVLALDTAGHRLFRLAPRATAAAVAVTLPDTTPLSIAPADNGVVYLATTAGLARVDLTTRKTVPVKGAKGVDLSGLTRIRWYRGALAGLQKTAGGAYRAVRIPLDGPGRTATAIEVLDPSVEISNPTAATVVGGVLYYLADADGGDMTVRRVALRP
jgi:hypothetical protein